MKWLTKKEMIMDISMLLGAAAAIMIAVFADFARECDEIRENSFRLHILANSNSVYDQQIKYALRDYILEDFGDIFTSCETKEETISLAERNLSFIEQRANEFLEDRGCGYTAVCSIENTEFPTRRYEDFTLPAGNYDALKVVLGNGGGANWWCVLYPSVCISAATPDKTVFPTRTLYEKKKRSDKMTADSLAAQRDGIEFRFAVYDFIKEIFGI